MNSIDTLPADFSGLLHPPDAEVGVYLLMGLLWEYLPYRFAIESFELDPKREGHTHTKYLDAKAKVLLDDGWTDSTLEFKLNSSGFLRDLKTHPGLFVDFLICWVHDAPQIERNVNHILELKTVYSALPEAARKKIIFNPDYFKYRGQKKITTGEVLQRFSDSNRAKVERLITLWPQVAPGTAELLYMRGAVTMFRACAYSSEHLIVGQSSTDSSLASLAEQFHGKELQTSVRIPLKELGDNEMLELIAQIKSS